MEGNDHNQQESESRLAREKREEKRDCSEGLYTLLDRDAGRKEQGRDLLTVMRVSRPLPVSLASFPSVHTRIFIDLFPPGSPKIEAHAEEEQLPEGGCWKN